MAQSKITSTCITHAEYDEFRHNLNEVNALHDRLKAKEEEYLLQLDKVHARYAELNKGKRKLDNIIAEIRDKNDDFKEHIKRWEHNVEKLHICATDFSTEMDRIVQENIYIGGSSKSKRAHLMVPTATSKARRKCCDVEQDRNPSTGSQDLGFDDATDFDDFECHWRDAGIEPRKSDTKTKGRGKKSTPMSDKMALRMEEQKRMAESKKEICPSDEKQKIKA